MIIVVLVGVGSRRAFSCDLFDGVWQLVAFESFRQSVSADVPESCEFALGECQSCSCSSALAHQHDDSGTPSRPRQSWHFLVN